MFDPAFPLERLHGAEYNPRKIDQAAFDALCESVRRLGFVKPAVATQDGLIVAGHQRTRAGREVGLTTAPVWTLKAINQADELRLNQLHNSEMDNARDPVHVAPGTTPGWAEVPAAAISGNMRDAGAAIRAEIAQLIAKYGPYNAAVASLGGQVLSGQQYALACKLLRVPVRVFYVRPEDEAFTRAAFGRAYGEFSYDHLVRQTWIQTFAQLWRLRGTQRACRSPLYERIVIPHITKTTRILDFGCGQGDYVELLAWQGYQIFGVEFFAREGSLISPARVHAMIDRALESWSTQGPFDVVLADSVLNSVDSLQAESDVLTCLSALARPGGMIAWSGRDIAHPRRSEASVNAAGVRKLEFLDAHGFSAIYRQGAWFYQKFHSLDDVRRLGQEFFGDVHVMRDGDGVWQAWATKSRELPVEQVEAALRREFDLPWPGGRSVGRADQAVAAWRAAQDVHGRRT